MGQSADQIRQEIDANRSDAGQKIDELQGQLQGQADHMQQQAKDTVDHARDQVQDTVHTAVESVQNFDYQQQIQDRPLLSAGVALIGGFVLGGMMGGGDGGNQQHSSGGSSQSSGQQGRGMGSQIRSAAQKSGLEDTFSNAAAALMGSFTEQLKGTLNSNFPGFSEKMDTAQGSQGSFSEKSKATQQEAQRSSS